MGEVACKTLMMMIKEEIIFSLQFWLYCLWHK